MPNACSFDLRNSLLGERAVARTVGKKLFARGDVRTPGWSDDYIIFIGPNAASINLDRRIAMLQKEINLLTAATAMLAAIERRQAPSFAASCRMGHAGEATRIAQRKSPVNRQAASP